jgi:hypothetical protein
VHGCRCRLQRRVSSHCLRRNVPTHACRQRPRLLTAALLLLLVLQQRLLLLHLLLVQQQEALLLQ